MSQASKVRDRSCLAGRTLQWLESTSATVSSGAKICEHFDCQTVLATYT